MNTFSAIQIQIWPTPESEVEEMPAEVNGAGLEEENSAGALASPPGTTLKSLGPATYFHSLHLHWRLTDLLIKNFGVLWREALWKQKLQPGGRAVIKFLC